jgi:hypothetical protein
MFNYLQALIRAATTATSFHDLSLYAGDSSGYVREAAVRQCAQLADPELLPIVAERLNDWVPEVGAAAREALLTMLLAAPEPLLMAHLPLMLRLHGGTGRGDSAAWLATFEPRLVEVLGPEVLAEQARHADIVTARACIGLLRRYRLLAPSLLVGLVLGRGDDIVLAHAAVQQIVAVPVDQRRPFYTMALRSHFGAVRTAALAGLLASDEDAPAANQAVAIAALTDSQSSARYVARTYLAARGFDARAHYRQLLGQRGMAKTAQICLAEIASLRDPRDVELVQSLVADSRVMVRLAALAAWFKLVAADKDHIARVALGDSAPRVRKFAATLVRRYGAYIPFADIARQLDEAGDLALLLRMAESQQWHWLESIARLSVRLGHAQALELGLPASLSKWLAQTQLWYGNASAGQVAYLCSEPVRNSLRALLGQPHAGLATLERELDARLI